MTKEEAKANQDRIAKDYDLGFWYGTECEVCGKRTEPFDMPWQSAEAWNNHEFIAMQVRWM